MIESINIYLPKSKHNVDIDIYLPRKRKDITFDSLYLLDGQNAFLDTKATYGCSIKAGKHIEAFNKVGTPLIGIAIHSSKSELGRLNEYFPYKLTKKANALASKHSALQSQAFCEDVIHTIIPYIEKHYPVFTGSEHRMIYGSSLAAITALYLGFKGNAFQTMGCFSTASFLNEDAVIKSLNDNMHKSKKVFIYVGKHESSDEIFTPNDYFDSSLKLYSYLLNNDVKTEFVIDDEGIHNESYWEKHLDEFLLFREK